MWASLRSLLRCTPQVPSGLSIPDVDSAGQSLTTAIEKVLRVCALLCCMRSVRELHCHALTLVAVKQLLWFWLHAKFEQSKFLIQRVSLLPFLKASGSRRSGSRNGLVHT